MTLHPSIKHIAQEACVSTQTVSRVLNKRPDVAPETRARIQAIIDRMDYQPNALARSLIHQRSLTIGVVIAGLEHRGPSGILSGISQQAERSGYTVVLKELVDPRTCDTDVALRSLLSRRVDGIIWAVPGIGGRRNWAASGVYASTTPLICLSQADQPGLAVVTIDNYRGGCLATQHLLDRGYRHIGHISGPLDWQEANLRKQGWADAVLEAGIEPAPNHWAAGDWTSKSGVLASRQLLDQYPQMDAVFAANDQMALGLLSVAWQLGRRIPDQLGVVGFDDLPEAEYFCPPLTTVHQDTVQLGTLAVEEIVKMIEAVGARQTPREPTTVLVAPRLVVRQS
jgi:LacI family transcriptional regulator